jgi:hypothetical protein
MNKPVLTWAGGGDQNHTFMLRGSDTIYTHENIADKLANVRDYITAEDWRLRVAEFTPEQVMAKFKEVFF